MNTNDTSTHLRSLPRRKPWRKSFHQNYKRYRLTFYGTKNLIITLWNLTKKYEGALKHQEVVPIKEAEIDREEVTESYKIVETPWERDLDGRFYHHLATMQHRRDSNLAIPEISPHEWIYYFANEVKRRATPLLYLVSPEKAVPPFGLPPEDAPVALANPPTPTDQQAMQKLKIPYEELSYDSLELYRNALIQRLQGKRINYFDLANHLTNWELDLLSQMIRDNTINATFGKSAIQFHKSSRNITRNPEFVAVAIAARNYEEVSTQ
ncbi:MAG: hypothetical protein ACFE89_03310 [Candidatus Hodarchaeota archaeon]